MGFLSKIVRGMGEAGGWVRGFNSVFSWKHVITVILFLANQVETLFNAKMHIISTFHINEKCDKVLKGWASCPLLLSLGGVRRLRAAGKCKTV